MTADSIAIDPHKHGLQPYGCGCILFKDPAAGRWYKHNSPYTYFTSNDLHLGEISLECSRPGAVAAALWATQTLLPLTRGGEFAQGFAQGQKRRPRIVYFRLRGSRRALRDPVANSDLDMVIFALRAASGEQRSVRSLSRQSFRRCCQARFTSRGLADLPHRTCFRTLPPNMQQRSANTITCLRSVLMKPAHFDWLDQIWQRHPARPVADVAKNTKPRDFRASGQISRLCTPASSPASPTHCCI